MEHILNFTGINQFVKLLNKIKNKELRAFISFFLTAVLGAGTNFLSQIPYKSLFLNLGYEDKPALNLSVFAGYLTATVVSFIPTKIFAFSAKESGNSKRESIKFLLIAVIAMGIQVGITSLTFDYIATPFFSNSSLFLREKGSHVVGMGFSFFANFYGHKFLTFRSTGVYDRIKARSTR